MRSYVCTGKKMRSFHCLIALTFVSFFCATAFATEVERSAPNSVQACAKQELNSHEIGKLNEAIAVCSGALKDSDLKGIERAMALMNRGVAYRNAAELDKSLRDLLDAKSLAPDNALIIRMLAWTYRTMQREADAENEYDRALQLEPNPQGFLSRCVVRIDRKNYQQALDDCERAYKDDVNEDSIYFTGLLYAKLGRQAEAMHVLEPALNSSYSSGRIFEVLAEVYDMVGRTADAARLRSEVHSKFPHDSDLKLPPKQ